MNELGHTFHCLKPTGNIIRQRNERFAALSPIWIVILGATKFAYASLRTGDLGPDSFTAKNMHLYQPPPSSK
jgi:hypothetical protein